MEIKLYFRFRNTKYQLVSGLSVRLPDQRQPGGGPATKGPPETLQNHSWTDSEHRLTERSTTLLPDSFMDWNILYYMDALEQVEHLLKGSWTMKPRG